MDGHQIGAAGTRRMSAILAALPASVPGERISLGDIVDALRGRAFAPLIVIFAAPNMLPVALPGISAVLGAPLVLLMVQLMLGWQRPWLPGFLRRRSLSRPDFERLLRRIVPRLEWIEDRLQRRWLPLTAAPARRAIGAVGVVLALVIMLPVPFGNAVPGLALVLMATGLLGRDGGAVLAGFVVGLFGLVVVSGFVYGGVQAAALMARDGFGL